MKIFYLENLHNLIPIHGLLGTYTAANIRYFVKNLDFRFIYSLVARLLTNTCQHTPLRPERISITKILISLTLSAILCILLYPIKFLLLGFGFLHQLCCKNSQKPLAIRIENLKQSLLQPIITINPQLEPQLPPSLKQAFSDPEDNTKLCYFNLSKTLHALQILTPPWKAILTNLCTYKSHPNGKILARIMAQYNKALQDHRLSFIEKRASAAYIALHAEDSLATAFAAYSKLLDFYKHENSVENLLLLWILEFKECLLLSLAIEHSLNSEDIFRFKQQYSDLLGLNFQFFKKLIFTPQEKPFEELFQQFCKIYASSASKLINHIELCIYNSSPAIKKAIAKYLFSQLEALGFNPQERVLVMYNLFYSYKLKRELNQLGIRFLLDRIHALLPYAKKEGD